MRRNIGNSVIDGRGGWFVLPWSTLTHEPFLHALGLPDSPELRGTRSLPLSYALCLALLGSIHLAYMSLYLLPQECHQN